MIRNTDNRGKYVFFKLGGTWDMVNRDGRLVGEGDMDDIALKSLEKSIGYFNDKVDYSNLEWEFAQEIYEKITANGKRSRDISSVLSWIEDSSIQVKGKFISLFSADSSHLRTSIIAPLISYLLEHARENDYSTILGAQGTDTADIALLPLLEAYTFDTNLPPFIFTGSNKSHFEKNSDAPKNFKDLLRVAHGKLPAGGYWVFSGNLFHAGDLVKISPLDSRIVDNFSTFYSPHLSAKKIDILLKSSITVRNKVKTPANHIVYSTTMEKLYHSMKSVHIVDLSEQNELEEDMQTIVDYRYKAVIIAGHSFGNVSNPIKFACIKAIMNNKLVIVTSRCFITDINQRYGVSLLSINTNELLHTGKQAISARKLNRNIARALAVRAVQENLNSKQTENLFAKYTKLRKLTT